MIASPKKGRLIRGYWNASSSVSVAGEGGASGSGSAVVRRIHEGVLQGRIKTSWWVRVIGLSGSLLVSIRVLIYNHGVELCEFSLTVAMRENESEVGYLVLEKLE